MFRSRRPGSGGNKPVRFKTQTYLVGGVMNLVSEDRPEQNLDRPGQRELFRLFGAHLVQGRTFTAEETRLGGAHVAVLSYGLWQRRFGGAHEVVGGTLSLDGEPYMVVGILESGFDAQSLSPFQGTPPEIWVPLQLESSNLSHANIYYAAARLRAESTLEVAEAQTRVASDAFRRAFPDEMRAAESLGVQSLQSVVVGDARPSLLLLMGAVAFVLLMVCANTANLLLVRASARQRELAIRSATVASRSRIVRQLLSESVVLASAGGVLGIGVGFAGIRALLAMRPDAIPRLGEGGAGVTMDWRVLLFTVTVSLATGVAFGLVPSLHASRVGLDVALRSGERAGLGPRHNKARGVLVIAEVALAVMLLISSALLLRSFVELRAVNPGFDSHGILTMRMATTGPRFAATASTAQLLRDGVESVSTVPGVVAAAATLTGLPLEGAAVLNIDVVGRPVAEYRALDWNIISSAYFEVFKIPLVRGRFFTRRDRLDSPPVAIISQSTARRFWPNGDPLNDRIIVGQGAGSELDERIPRQIVGVVGDIHQEGLERDPRLTVTCHWNRFLIGRWGSSIASADTWCGWFARQRSRICSATRFSGSCAKPVAGCR